MATATVNSFDTMFFKIEVDAYVKCKYMIKQKIHKAYSLVLGKCTKLLKINSSLTQVEVKHPHHLMS